MEEEPKPRIFIVKKRNGDIQTVRYDSVNGTFKIIRYVHKIK